MSFGTRLKEKREALGITQPQLAKTLGVSQSAVGSWETDVNSPRATILYDLFEILHCDANYLLQDEIKELYKNEATPDEFENIIKKYRYIAKHSPNGAKTINAVLENEYAIAEQLQKQKDHIEELENTHSSTIIDIQTRLENNTRFIEYHHSASAGTWVFILGNETVDQLPILDTPENRKVDYAIKVSGNSMEPDYNDGDIVLVSQKVELNHGDVGIFIVNNKAYIKEYGVTELISHNPEADNINIAEYDNIVCLGKVIGKYRQ